MTAPMTTPQAPFQSALAPLPSAQIPDANWLRQTLRMTGWVLFMARRRVMGKILIGLLLGLFAVVVGFQVFIYYAIANARVDAGENCAPVGTPAPNSNQPQQIVCQPPTQQEIDQAQAQQRQTANNFRDSYIAFPGAIGIAGIYTSYMGVFFLCILAGALVGGEYGFSTQRLAFMRGVTRAQMVTAQLAALAVLALVVAAAMIVLGIIVGIGVAGAMGSSFTFPPPRGYWELLVYWMALAFNLFAYGLIAFFMATLGKSTAAGIGVALVYLLLELVVGSILTGLGSVGEAVNNATLKTVGHIPDWFLGTNLGALTWHAGQYPLAITLGSNSLDPLRSFFVALAYCAVFIGLGYYIVRTRDVLD
ncbi:MAG: hypothetical protein ABI068_16315 [Ktedonobacterales bacterium]